MNILWIKDGKIGHEKQVKTLLDELSKTNNISIINEDFPPPETPVTEINFSRGNLISRDFRLFPLAPLI